MTTITINRATVEQALEAMRRAVPTGQITLYEWDKAMSDLSAALTQQAEPVEPVAKVELMMTGGNAGLATRIVEIDDHLRERLRPGQLLYTAPPQLKPLPKHDQHCVDVPGYGLMAVRLVRAVERAHGITDPQVADRLVRHGIPMPGDPK